MGPAPAEAQMGAAASVQMGPTQQINTKTTETFTKTRELGPDGQMVDKETRSSENQRLHGDYKYSGLPGRWFGGIGRSGPEGALAKDSGPRVSYHLDHLPAGANPEEALWVRMDDGRLMMLDPKDTQRLR